MAYPRLLPAAGRLRRLRLRGGDLGGGRPRAARRPSIESGIGAFYLLAAVMAVASSRHRLRLRRRATTAIRYVQRYSDSAQPLFYKLTSYWGGLDGSIMFWVFLLSLFGSGGHHDQPRAPPGTDSLRRGGHRGGGDVLPLPDDRAQQPVRDVPHGRAHRRRGAEPAAAELLHGHPPADHVPGLRRPDDSVRVRHGGAHHRPPRRLVAARGAPLDDDLVAVPVGRPRPRHDLGLRGTRLGRLLGLGSRSRTRACCRGSRPPRSCTR